MFSVVLFLITQIWMIKDGFERTRAAKTRDVAQQQKAWSCSCAAWFATWHHQNKQKAKLSYARQPPSTDFNMSKSLSVAQGLKRELKVG